MIVASGATLNFNNASAVDYAGNISGGGALTKTNSGTLTLSGDNSSFTGPITLSQGTLYVTNPNGLGSGSTTSTLSLADGTTLRIGADVATSRNVSLTGEGTMSVDSGASLTLNGTVSGTGALIKSGTGTLTLTGTNTYEGGTTLAGGTISIASDANLGVSDTTALAAGKGALTFDGGTLQTAVDWTTARTLTAASTGSIDNAGKDVSLTGKLLGAGGLTLAGTGTDTLAATFNGSGFSGTLTRSAGTLQLVSGAQLSGTLAISDGATLSGVGTVGNLTVGGTISPGNSPGTITANGNFTQGATGTYVCQVSPTDNDLIAVTGSATLSGTINIQPEYTYYNSGTTWNVLTATGGVTGTYATVTYGVTPENWMFVPVYSANAVTITLQRQSYSSSAASAQSAAVGSGLDAAAYSATGEMASLIKTLDASYGTTDPASGSSQALAKAITATTTNALTNYTLNVLSPEIYDAATQNVFEIGRLLTTAQRAGLHEGGDAGAGQGFTSPLDIGPASLAAQSNQNNGVLGLGTPGGNNGPSLSMGRLSVFLKTLGMRACQQGSASQTGYVSLAAGITGGVLYRPSAELTLGLAPGFVSQSLRLHSEGGGQGTVNDWSLGLLAAYRHGPFYADADIRGGYNTFHSSRSLPLPSGNYTAKADWTGWNTNLSVGGGYDFEAGAYTFGPLASVSWQFLHENGFSESGAGSLSQSVRAKNTHSLNTVLGARVARIFETTAGEVTPELRVGWSAQWLGDTQNIVATFAGAPASTYQAKTQDHRYQAALVDLGVKMDLSPSLAATTRVGVELFRPGYEAQAASVELKYSF